MAKAVKKTKSTRSVSRAKKTKITEEITVPVMPKIESTPVSPSTMFAKAPMMNPKILRAALVVVLLALLTYKAGPWVFPVMVNNKPISRFTVWNKMEKAYGQQTLDEMVNEKVLDAAIAKNGVKVDQAKVAEQMTNLEKQFESVGGLDEALKQRGLTRVELEKQVVTQLSVEEILKDKINPTEEEIKTDFDENATTLYKDKKLDDVKSEIITKLKDTKLREAFLEWFAEVKKDIKVQNFGL